MKVLVVHPGAHFSVADVHNGLLKGLRANGVDAQEFNLHDRLNFYSEAHLHRGGEWVLAFEREAAITMAAKGLEVVLYEWWPDVVIIVSGFFIPPAMWAVLARRPHHVVLWGTESPYEDDRQLRPAEYADTVILNDPVNIDMFRAVNERTYYLPHSYDPDVHHPGPADPDLACDFAFVGTGFPSRQQFFEQVAWPEGCTIALGGNWQGVTNQSALWPLLLHMPGDCMDNTDTARLYRSCKVGANLYRQEATEESHADGWAMGPREVELAACQTFFLRNPRPEGDALFPMLPTFSEPGEFSDLLAWALTHPDESHSAAVAARAAIGNRTFTNTTARLLRLVDGAGKPVR